MHGWANLRSLTPRKGIVKFHKFEIPGEGWDNEMMDVSRSQPYISSLIIKMRVSPLFSRRLFTCPSFQPLSRLSRLSKFRMTKAREKLHHKQQSGRLGGWALTFESTGGSFRSRGLGMLFSDQFSLNFCFTSPSRGYTTNAVDLSNKINFTSEAFTSLQHNKIPKFHGARSLWINLKFPNVPNPAVTPANKSCGSKGKTPAAPPPGTIELRS